MIRPIYYYSIGSIIYTILNIYFAYININWEKINYPVIIIYFTTYTLSTISISEIFLTNLLIPFQKNIINNSDIKHDASIIINYNLKAYTRTEIDLCFKNMYNAYINNIFNESIAVLISVTSIDYLREYEKIMLFNYRSKIYNNLLIDGEKYLKNPLSHSKWKDHIFSMNDLKQFCTNKCENFILIYRDTNILKKCGQYQDLITFNQGYNVPYTYTDTTIYNNNSRLPNKYLSFLDINDYNKLFNKKYKYTLVLDSDTILSENFIENIINTAELNPEYSIYQPNIKFINIYTFFQHLQKIWLDHSNISYCALSNYFKHSLFFGKGLINNEKYIEQCIGYPDNLIEFLPSNALSHDTFESICMPIMYVPNYSLLEEAPKSFLSWNFRELRWNMGELIVFYHLFPRFFYKKIRYKRNNYKLSFTNLFFGLAAFRVMIMKPILLFFIIINTFINYKNFYLAYSFMILTIIIIPNFIVLLSNKKIPIIYILTTFVHSLPEPFIGTIRLIIALHKVFTENISWLPSSSVEQHINTKGIISSSFYYFGISSLITIILFIYNYNTNILLSCFLLSIILLPLYNLLSNINMPSKFRFDLKKIKVIKE